MMIRKKRHVDCRNASRVDSELNTALEINERICTSVMGKEDDEGRDEDGGCKFSSRRKSFVRQEEDQRRSRPQEIFWALHLLCGREEKIFAGRHPVSALGCWQGSDKADKDLAVRSNCCLR